MKLSNLIRGIGKKEKITNKMVIEKINKVLIEIDKIQSNLKSQVDFGNLWFEAKTEASNNLNKLHKAEVELAEVKKDNTYKEETINEMKQTYFKREKIPADRSKGKQTIGIKNRSVQSNIISKVKGANND